MARLVSPLLEQATRDNLTDLEILQEAHPRQPYTTNVRNLAARAHPAGLQTCLDGGRASVFSQRWVAIIAAKFSVSASSNLGQGAI